MGRKKGKQRGQHSSKAKNAAHLFFELSQHVTDVHQELRQTTSSGNSGGGSEKNELSRLKNERGAVSLSLLHGRLRERVFEDRERDATYRRQVMTASIVNSQWQSQQVQENTVTKDENIGWTLIYDYREAMAGIDEQSDKVCEKLLENTVPKQNIPSLQLLCIQTLALYLQQYINSCGEEYVVNRLSLLQSCVISALSVSCREVTDQMVYVFGKQSHNSLTSP